MLHLARRSSPAWGAWAADHADELLVDHAHCEKKAASTALGLLFRYPEAAPLQRPLSALVREEISHFERVLDLLDARNVPFGPKKPGSYAHDLRAACRAHEPARLVDTLLCCGLIEARSCERMRLAIAAFEARGLDDVAALYRDLLADEARHHRLFVDLAEAVAPPDLDVRARLAELAEVEARALAAAAGTVHLHGGP